MAVSVLLDLSQTVSVPDLQHFLSYIPEGFDLTEDLRCNTGIRQGAQFLEIPLPIPGAQP